MPDEEKYRLEHPWKERVFYVEWRTKDQSNVKVYDQKRTVEYADYKVGLFYISPLTYSLKGRRLSRSWRKRNPHQRENDDRKVPCATAVTIGN